MPTSPRLVVLLVAIVAAEATAQCALAVPPGDGITGVDGTVFASTWWDPDGTGPLGPRLVVGGTFYQVAEQLTRNIAAWDPATGEWSTFGSGLPATQINALATLPNGDLVAAGNFALTIGGQAEHIARWNGTAWVSLGGGCNAPVFALGNLPNGDLVAAGEFVFAGGVAATRVATWNGSSWQPLGAGVDSTVTALTRAPNGDLLVVGHFLNAGGAPASRIARWNGATWAALGSGLAIVPLAVTCLPNGDVVAGGNFTTTASRIARWDGTTWNAFGSGANHQVNSLFTRANGDLVVGGEFTLVDGTAASRVATWNGSSWSALSSGMPSGRVFTFAETPTGELIAGGHFFAAGGEALDRIARWDGTAWHALAEGITGNGFIADVEELADGSLVVGGIFGKVGGVPATNVARWNGTNWQPMGAGLDSRVADLLELPNGDLVAVGGFNGSAARWNGTSWTSIGNIGNSSFWVAASLPGGDLVAASTTGSSTWSLQRFDGTSWSTFATLSSGARVDCMATMPNGDLVVGGRFTSIGGTNATAIARWDGSTWHGFTPGVLNAGDSVHALHVLPNGDLVAAGTFAFYLGFVQINRIGRWNGASWQPFGTGLVGMPMAIAESVNGELLVTGQNVQTTGIQGNEIARWNGTAWASLGTGLGGEPSSPVRVEAMTRLANGEIVLGGFFRTVDGVVSNNLARIMTTCPANVVAAGAGCGTATLTADHPWTGTTWTSRASNLPPAALVFAAFGFTPTTLPLANVFATALPGCTLHVTPDHVTMNLAANGVVATQYTLPANPALTGITFRHQMVPLALDATLAVTATNALLLIVGTW